MRLFSIFMCMVSIVMVAFTTILTIDNLLEQNFGFALAMAICVPLNCWSLLTWIDIYHEETYWG